MSLALASACGSDESSTIDDGDTTGGAEAGRGGAGGEGDAGAATEGGGADAGGSAGAAAGGQAGEGGAAGLAGASSEEGGTSAGGAQNTAGVTEAGAPGGGVAGSEATAGAAGESAAAGAAGANGGAAGSGGDDGNAGSGDAAGAGGDAGCSDCTAAARLHVGVDEGAAPNVASFDGATLADAGSFFAFAASFMGGVRVASGDVNGDGVTDIVAGTGPGGSGQVRVYDGGTGELLRSPIVFGRGFDPGVFVAAGDVNDDGFADVIVGTDEGVAARVRVLSGADYTELTTFFAYTDSFTGGVRVASADVNGDGVADIVTGAGPGGGPHVKAFDGLTFESFASFFAFSPSFTGGIYVAAGDLGGDGHAELVVGAGSGAGPEVSVFDGETLASVTSFFAYTPAFTGGVRVASGDLDGDGLAELVTGAGPGAGPHVKVFGGSELGEQGSFFAFDVGFTGGVFVAAP